MLAALVIAMGMGSAAVALVWARRFYVEMMAADEGTELMREIATSVRVGAAAYLKQQNKWVLIVFVVVALLLGVVSFGWNFKVCSLRLHS